jgi:hypothetical protein
MEKLLTWLDGKKTYLCALGFVASMLGTAICWKLELVTYEQAVQLLVSFGGIFGGGGLAALRSGIKKNENQ